MGISDELYEEACALQLEEEGREKARGIFQKVIDEFPESEAARHARSQLEDWAPLILDKSGPSDVTLNTELKDEAEEVTEEETQSLGEPVVEAHQVESKFSALYFISGILKICSVLSFFIGAVSLLSTIKVFGLMTCLGGLCSLAFVSIIIWAFAELILVLLAIEENTRHSQHHIGLHSEELE